MGWKTLATGNFACSPEAMEGELRVVVGIDAIVKLMKEPASDQKIIFTNVAGGSAVSTIIQKASAIVSTIGGPNSHIVVVARDYGKPCIVGASGIDLNSLPDGSRVRLDTDGSVSILCDDAAEIVEPDYSILRKIAFAGVVASVEAIIGVPTEILPGHVDALASRDLLATEGLIMLTERGTQAVEAQYAREREAFAGLEDQVINDFRPLDLELKRIARSWQDYEAADDWDGKLTEILAMAKLRTDTLTFVGRYIDRLPRLEEYELRLTAALRYVEAGETDYVVSVKADSLHTIWFQFHEDLLRLLQRERDAE
ncbi:PEP-utilising enzyme, mobile domain [Sphingobium faniae]|nr:PEP-utilising enzyme, mobile domain [Sphingobium faniae]